MNAHRRRLAALLATTAAVLTAAGLSATAATTGQDPRATAAGGSPNGKAGVASAVYLDRNPRKLIALGASWAYDWSPQLHPVNLGIRWVPMIWSARYLTPSTLASLTIARQSGIRYLLGFNEPDNRRQANMSPLRAADLWPKLERTGLILGSPAPTTPTNGWLARFMHLVHERHLRVNFIALHYYMDYTNPNSVDAMRAQLIHIHQEYGLPIWITELGALDIRRWGQHMLHDGTVPLAQTYMHNVFRMLDGLSFVQRYAWYTDSCAHQPGCQLSSLYTARGAITPEGREFRRDA